MNVARLSIYSRRLIRRPRRTCDAAFAQTEGLFVDMGWANFRLDCFSCFLAKSRCWHGNSRGCGKGAFGCDFTKRTQFVPVGMLAISDREAVMDHLPRRVSQRRVHRRERRRRWGAPPQAPGGEALKALEGAFLLISRYTGTEREHNRVIIDRCDGRPTPLLVRG